MVYRDATVRVRLLPQSLETYYLSPSLCGHLTFEMTEHVMAQDAMLQGNIEEMNKLEGFNVVIICCSSAKLAHYWQERLEKGKGSVLSPGSLVLCVDEDWPGGAGNGTLCVALQYACCYH